MSYSFSALKELIDEELEIQTLIEDYNIKIQRKGKDFVALCPFHDDKNPSMSISVKKKIFKCFSCNVGGGVVKFVSLIETIPMRQALQKVAKKYFPNRSWDWDSEIVISPEKAKILEINKELLIFFKSQILSPTQEIKDFFEKRKISDKIVFKYELGFAPKDGKKAFQFLKQKNFKNEDIFRTELFDVDSRNNESVRCFLSNRVIFPLKNSEGELLGFSGRTIEDQSVKFLISRENLVFKKSEILFNMSFVLEHFLAKKEIFVVEGFFDAIRLTEEKIPAVAALGTNLTHKQVDILKERFSSIIVFPDGDEAGINAALRSAQALLDRGIKTKVLNHQTKLDPDELIIQRKDIIENYEGHLLSPLLFLLKTFNTKEKEKIDELLKKSEIFLKYSSEVEKYEFFKKLSAQTEIPVKNLEREILTYQTSLFQDIYSSEEPKKDDIKSWEKTLLGLIAQSSKRFKKMVQFKGRFDSEKANKIWNIEENKKENNSSKQDIIVKRFQSYKREVEMLIEEKKERIFDELVIKWRINELNFRKKKLERERLKTNYPEKEKEEILKKINKIKEEIKDLA